MIPLIGVNLGGWLVLEKWLTPSVFAGTTAEDEYALCKQLGGSKKTRLQQHYQQFITREDFRWLANHGVAAVRIPVGYWVFGDAEPYEPTIDYLDWALETAADYNLKVLIDLHAAPGSQNGWPHSGRAGTIGWHTQAGAIDQTLKILKHLAERYQSATSLAGIELLNEPHWKIPLNTLADFYHRGYSVIRKACGHQVAVVVSDSFRPLEWLDMFTAGAYENLWLDVHWYQVFAAQDKKLSFESHIRKAGTEWREQLEAIQAKLPVLVGEWSLALDRRAFRGIAENEQQAAYQAYARAQLNTFNHAQAGWFYWTYKTELPSAWSYRNVVQRSWLNLS